MTVTGGRRSGECLYDGDMATVTQGVDGDASVRTHLANERTFLAWLRTGLTSIALGLAASQGLDAHEVGGMSMPKLLGALLVLFGVWLCALGRWRYRQAAAGISTMTFATRQRAFEPLLFVLALVGVISLVIVTRP